jgi:hypothetical protein
MIGSRWIFFVVNIWVMYIINKFVFLQGCEVTDFVLGQDQETMDLVVGKLEANLRTMQETDPVLIQGEYIGR